MEQRFWSSVMGNDQEKIQQREETVEVLESRLPQNWQYYHDTFKMVNTFFDSPHDLELAHHLGSAVNDYFNKNAVNGIIRFSTLPQHKIDEVAQIIYNSFREFYIMKSGLSDATLRELSSSRLLNSMSELDRQLSSHLGNLDIPKLVQKIRSIGEMRPDNIYDSFAKIIHSAHIEGTAMNIIEQSFPSIDTSHLRRGAAYIHIAIRNNPVKLKSMGVHDYTSFEDFWNDFKRLCRTLHHTYDPMNPNTFI